MDGVEKEVEETGNIGSSGCLEVTIIYRWRRNTSVILRLRTENRTDKNYPLSLTPWSGAVAEFQNAEIFAIPWHRVRRHPDLRQYSCGTAS